MNTALSLLILTELVLFFLWVSFAKKDKKKSKDLTSGMMFLVALVILYQVFKLNLDFGLVLSFATLFAAVSWLFGKVISLKELQVEGTKGLGNSICANKEYIKIGAYETNNNGSVCIYDRNEHSWQTITKGENNSFFGGSISNYDNLLAIGSYRYGDNERGAVFVYNLDTNQVEETIIPEPDKDWFGYSIHLNNSDLLVGSVKENIVYRYKI